MPPQTSPPPVSTEKRSFESSDNDKDLPPTGKRVRLMSPHPQTVTTSDTPSIGGMLQELGMGSEGEEIGSNGTDTEPDHLDMTNLGMLFRSSHSPQFMLETLSSLPAIIRETLGAELHPMYARLTGASTFTIPVFFLDRVNFRSLSHSHSEERRQSHYTWQTHLDGPLHQDDDEQQNQRIRDLESFFDANGSRLPQSRPDTDAVEPFEGEDEEMLRAGLVYAPNPFEYTTMHAGEGLERAQDSL